MKINGKEIDFKISRLKDASAMELALNNFEKAETASKDKKGLTEIISYMIQIFRDFFIDATGVDVLDGCDDLEVAKIAYYDFIEQVTSQKMEIINFSANDIK